MSIANYFYHASTKKYIALFGTLFNKISIARFDGQGNETQRMIVPISYGPYQKFLARVVQDPNLDKKPAITLPRMSFEIVNVYYDQVRKLPSLNILNENISTDPNKKYYKYVPAPYNIEFTLNIMTKYAEDGTQILEQIIPFFKPEWTSTVKVIDEIDPLDIPLILTSTIVEDIYEGDFESRRSLLWTLTFTMKCWFFGPSRNQNVIKYIDIRYAADTKTNSKMLEQTTIQPGLTSSGNPTSDINETIHYDQIEIDDDWGIITIFNKLDD